MHGVLPRGSDHRDASNIRDAKGQSSIPLPTQHWSPGFLEGCVAPWLAFFPHRVIDEITPICPAPEEGGAHA